MRSPLRALRRRLRPQKKQAPRKAHRRGGPPLPEVPAGWTLGPPDFIGIGVQKSGTTWWWTLLAAHPDMVGRIKETHHLARLGWRPMRKADADSYHRYFPRPAGGFQGEWTPRYQMLPGVPDTIATVAPEAKIVTILRDPLERYRSGVGQWRKRKTRLGEPLDIGRGTKDAYARSFYGFQLRRYLDVLGPERLLVLQFERCKSDPAGQYRRTLEFLGMPAWDPPAEMLGKPVNVTRTGKAQPSAEEQEDLIAAFEQDVRLLASLVPDLDLGLWPNFTHLANA